MYSAYSTVQYSSTAQVEVVHDTLCCAGVRYARARNTSYYMCFFSRRTQFCFVNLPFNMRWSASEVTRSLTLLWSIKWTPPWTFDFRLFIIFICIFDIFCAFLFAFFCSYSYLIFDALGFYHFSHRCFPYNLTQVHRDQNRKQPWQKQRQTLSARWNEWHTKKK